MRHTLSRFLIFKVAFQWRFLFKALFNVVFLRFVMCTDYSAVYRTVQYNHHFIVYSTVLVLQIAVGSRDPIHVC